MRALAAVGPWGHGSADVTPLGTLWPEYHAVSNGCGRLGSRSRSGAGRRSVVTLRTENARELEGGNSTKMKLLSFLVEVQKLARCAQDKNDFSDSLYHQPIFVSDAGRNGRATVMPTSRPELEQMSSMK
jgi:hypothetical protein